MVEVTSEEVHPGPGKDYMCHTVTLQSRHFLAKLDPLVSGLSTALPNMGRFGSATLVADRAAAGRSFRSSAFLNQSVHVSSSCQVSQHEQLPLSRLLGKFCTVRSQLQFQDVHTSKIKFHNTISHFGICINKIVCLVLDVSSP